jgi:hypothetical protein
MRIVVVSCFSCTDIIPLQRVPACSFFIDNNSWFKLVSKDNMSSSCSAVRLRSSTGKSN